MCTLQLHVTTIHPGCRYAGDPSYLAYSTMPVHKRLKRLKWTYKSADRHGNSRETSPNSKQHNDNPAQLVKPFTVTPSFFFKFTSLKTVRSFHHKRPNIGLHYVRPHIGKISRYLRNDAALSAQLQYQQQPYSGQQLLCSKQPRKFIHTTLICMQFIDHIFVADRPMFTQSRMVSSESHDIGLYVRQACRPEIALSGIGHSRSLKVILIGVGKNPERGVVKMYNNVNLIFELTKISLQPSNGKAEKQSTSTTPLRSDSNLIKASKYLQKNLYCPA